MRNAILPPLQLARYRIEAGAVAPDDPEPTIAKDDQQEPRRASLGLPRFARSGTPPIHVDDAGAGGRPECRKHAQAQARGGLTTVAVLTDPSPHTTRSSTAG